jgi:hypothetical protein
VRLSAWVRTDGIPESGRGGAGLVLTAMRGATIEGDGTAWVDVFELEVIER